MTIAFDEPRIGTSSVFGARPATRSTYQVAQRPPLRLTVRGRVVVVVAALAVLLAFVVMFGSAGSATNQSPSAEVTTVTVQAGQTLWSIAAQARPDADIRETVNEIIRLNALESGSKLSIGATLAVPTSN